MNNKILVLVLSLISVAFGGTVSAQTNDNPSASWADSLKNATPEQRARLQSDRMKDKLSLSDDQYKKVSDINLTYAKKMDPIMHSDDSKFSKYRKAKPLLEEKDDKLKVVLTPDQFKQYEAIKKEMMDRMRSK